MTNCETKPIKDKISIEKLKKSFKLQSYRDYILFLFCIKTGILINKIIHLKAVDVKGKNTIEILTGKNKLKKYIIDDLELQQELKFYIGNLSDNDYLFPSRIGQGQKNITPRMVNQIFNKISKKTGINISGITLRKTFGWWHYQEQKDLKYLQILFGHAAPSITRKFIDLE